MEIDISKIVIDAFLDAGWFTPIWYSAFFLTSLAETMTKRVPVIAAILFFSGMALDMPHFKDLWFFMAVFLIVLIVIKS